MTFSMTRGDDRQLCLRSDGHCRLATQLQVEGIACLIRILEPSEAAPHINDGTAAKCGFPADPLATCGDLIR
jgi:hypothetical protein